MLIKERSNDIFTIQRNFSKLVMFCGTIAGCLVFATMLLIVSNALLRKFFNAPLEGTLEITEAILPLIIFFSIAFTQLNKGHIRVTLAVRHLTIKVQKRLHIGAYICGACFFFWASIGTFQYAWESWLLKESAWGAIRFPIYPVKFIVCFGVVLLAIQFVFDAIDLVIEHRSKVLDLSNEN